MRWIFKYKDVPIFIRYYSNSVKSKNLKFYIDLKKHLKKDLVLKYKISIKPNSPFHEAIQMSNKDISVRNSLENTGTKKIIEVIAKPNYRTDLGNWFNIDSSTKRLVLLSIIE